MKTAMVNALVAIATAVSIPHAVAPPAAHSATLYVSSGPSDGFIQAPYVFPGIQAAVDAADPGDKVMVPNGTYTENVTIDKALTIVSKNGSAVTTVIAADPGRHVFRITAEDVTLTGFTAYGATGSTSVAGVYLSPESGNCTITNNRFGISPSQKNGVGIDIYESGGHTISQNDCRYNLYSGIDATRSDNTVISANDCSHNEGSGIYSTNSLNNLISGNECRYNSEHGIICFNPTDTVVAENETTYNHSGGIGLFAYGDLPLSGNRLLQNVVHNNDGRGIYVQNANGSLLSGNECTYNELDGICLFQPTDNVVTGNEANHNQSAGIVLRGTDDLSASGNLLLRNAAYDNDENGILIADGTDNRVIMNTIEMNGMTGLNLNSSSGNRCWLNNLLSNVTRQVRPGDTSNQWASPTLIFYTYAGILRTQFLGNHYDDHDLTDMYNDGVADSAYDLLSEGDPAYDNFPMATPSTDPAWDWNVTCDYEKIISSGSNVQVLSALTIIGGRITISEAVLTIGL